MKPKHWHLAAAAATLLLATAELPARVSETAGRTPAGPPARVATLQHDPQLILEAVAGRMGITLRPELGPPAILLESRTPLERLQAAAERQWGFRPRVFTTTYASAGNEIYLIDDADLYARYGGTPDDSLAHELVHYLQVTYLKDRFTTDWSASEAVAIQTWFRKEYMTARLFAAGRSRRARRVSGAAPDEPRRRAKMRNITPRTLLATLIAAALVAGIPLPAGGQEPPRTLKMQSSWPASLSVHDNFREIANRVDKLTGGQIKIETLSGGPGRPAVRGA